MVFLNKICVSAVIRQKLQPGETTRGMVCPAQKPRACHD